MTKRTVLSIDVSNVPFVRFRTSIPRMYDLHCSNKSNCRP